MSDDYLDEDKKSGRLILLLFACLGGLLLGPATLKLTRLFTPLAKSF